MSVLLHESEFEEDRGIVPPIDGALCCTLSSVSLPPGHNNRVSVVFRRLYFLPLPTRPSPERKGRA